MKLLFIGATGLLARPAIQQLDTGGHTLRLLSRSLKASDFPDKYEIYTGDAMREADLMQAMNSCEAIHISISHPQEGAIVEKIVAAACQADIRLISYMSGATVCDENRWFPMVDNKLKAEEALKTSGIPWIIFRPGWFFESLSYFIRDGKASILGTKPGSFRWLAADDYGRMLSAAYARPEAHNQTHYLFGQEKYRIDTLTEKYCQALYPQIKSVRKAPFPILSLIAFLSGNKHLKNAIRLFKYFEKTSEPDPDLSATHSLIGKPEIDFEKWIRIQKSK